MEKGPRTVEQPDDGDIDMQQLTWALRSDADLGFGGIDAATRPIPFVSFNRSAPGLVRCEDSSKPLGEDGEGANRQCLKSSASTMSRIFERSPNVRHPGVDRGQGGASSSAHRIAALVHSRKRVCRMPTSRRAALWPMKGFARSRARRIRLLLSAAGTRTPAKLAPVVRTRTSRSRMTATSTWTCFRSLTTWILSSTTSVPESSAVTTRGEPRRIQECRVDFGMPSPGNKETLPDSTIASRIRWSYFRRRAADTCQDYHVFVGLT